MRRRRGPERAKRSITLLSAILRNAMSTVKRRTVPLGEEIDMVRSYLQLESMRYEERLRVHFDIDPALERHPVPPMMLQTLVENAVRHGIAKLKKGGDVYITAHAGENGIVLTVRNTGHYNKGDQRRWGSDCGTPSNGWSISMAVKPRSASGMKGTWWYVRSTCRSWTPACHRK
ncbi:MAG: histidine kinase [Flavobacteriales bacterium]|nr:histidine kinase [Flavobacteriales bacterium]